MESRKWQGRKGQGLEQASLPLAWPEPLVLRHLLSDMPLARSGTPWTRLPAPGEAKIDDGCKFLMHSSSDSSRLSRTHLHAPTSPDPAQDPHPEGWRDLKWTTVTCFQDIASTPGHSPGMPRVGSGHATGTLWHALDPLAGSWGSQNRRQLYVSNQFQ